MDSNGYAIDVSKDFAPVCYTINCKNPQQYFATSIKAEIIEDLKKSLICRAVCRTEESLKLNPLLPEALDNIRYPYKSIEDKLSKILDTNQQIKDILVKKNKKYSSIDNGTVQNSTSNDDMVGGA